MFPRYLTALVLLTASATVAAQKLDINLSNDSAQFVYTALIGGSTIGRTEMNAGFLYTEDDVTLFDLGLQVVDLAGSKTPGLEVGVGPKFYYASSDKADASVSAIALGGQLRYKLPSAPRLAIGASAYYAPHITSTLDADSLFELNTRLSYEVLPTADAYIGYRKIRAKYDKGKGSEDLDNGIIFGLKFAF